MGTFFAWPLAGCGTLQPLFPRQLHAGNPPHPDGSPPAPPDPSPCSLPRPQEVWWFMHCSRAAVGNEDLLVDGSVLKAVGVHHLVCSGSPTGPHTQAVPQ